MGLYSFLSPSPCGRGVGVRGKRIEGAGRLSEEQADVQGHVLYGLHSANPACLLSHVPTRFPAHLPSSLP